MRERSFTQPEFRERVRAFVADEIVPAYPAWERAGSPGRDFWKRAAAAGILGIGVPEEHGGLPGSTFAHSVVVTEEIQRQFLAVGGLRVHTDICMPYLLKYANQEQKQRWLPRLTSGETVIALGLSEPEAGSDLKSISTRAARAGDSYVVNGAKTFISNGAAADLVILAVKTDPAAGRRGVSLLLVDAATPGFQRGRRLAKLGLKAQDLAELSFTDMRVPAANLLGEENRGFEYLTANLGQERLSIAVNSQAAATALLDHTVAAHTGGGTTQRVKFDLAACATEVAAGQALVDQCLAQLEAGVLTPADAAMAKLYCTELQGRVAQRCLRLFGAAALDRGHVASRALLDGRVSRVYGGSNEIMKVIISQSLGL